MNRGGDAENNVWCMSVAAAEHDGVHAAGIFKSGPNQRPATWGCRSLCRCGRGSAWAAGGYGVFCLVKTAGRGIGGRNKCPPGRVVGGGRVGSVCDMHVVSDTKETNREGRDAQGSLVLARRAGSAHRQKARCPNDPDTRGVWIHRSWPRIYRGLTCPRDMRQTRKTTTGARIYRPAVNHTAGFCCRHSFPLCLEAGFPPDAVHSPLGTPPLP